MRPAQKLRFIARAASRLFDDCALYAQLVITMNCNLSCAYCNEYISGARHIPTALLLDRIDKLDSLGVLVYDILGGEPLMHPDLSDLISRIKAKRHGANLVTVITNGFLLTEEIIDGLNRAGLDLMQLSIDSAQPGPYSMKSLKSLLPKLNLLRDRARFAVKIQTVLTDETVTEYDEFRRMLKDYPFDFSFSLLHHAGGRVAIQGGKFLSLLSRHDLWGGMRLYRKHAMAMLAGDYSLPWRCLGGFKFLYVNTRGHIQWCSQQQGASLPLMEATRADLRAANVHKPCESGCAVGCARLVSHALGQPLHSLNISLSTLAGIRRKTAAPGKLHTS